jgi:hypothetical protein
MFPAYEVFMNCPGCSAAIDYRFLTSCPQCGFEEVPATPAVVDSVATSCDEGRKKPLALKRVLANLACVIAASLVGLLVGAFMVYYAAGILYLAFFSGGHGGLGGSEECARGTAVAVLSILSGAFLGTVGGSFLASKHIIQRS